MPSAPGNLRRVPDWRQPGWAEGSSGEPSILLVMALGVGRYPATPDLDDTGSF